jgi:hypothetical protein
MLTLGRINDLICYFTFVTEKRDITQIDCQQTPITSSMQEP